MNRDLEKEILSIRILIEKTTNKELKKILKEQKRQLEKLRAEIGNIYMQYSDNEGLNMSLNDKIQSTKGVEKSLIDMGKVLAATEVSIMGMALYDAYKEGYYHTAYTLDKGVEVGINYKILRKEFVDSVVNANFEGQIFSDRIWKNKNLLVNQLYNSIEKGIKEGTQINKLSKEISNMFGTSAFNSRRLIRNESARIISNAQDQIYRDSEVVSQIMFNATLDNRTSDICIGLDGNVYSLNENYPKIPSDTHIQCRSCYVPVVDGWKPRTRRDNITKEVIPYQTYSEWKEQNNIN